MSFSLLPCLHASQKQPKWSLVHFIHLNTLILYYTILYYNILYYTITIKQGISVCTYVCMYVHISRTIYPNYFTLGRCIAGDQRTCSVWTCDKFNNNKLWKKQATLCSSSWGGASGLCGVRIDLNISSPMSTAGRYRPVTTKLLYILTLQPSSFSLTWSMRTSWYRNRNRNAIATHLCKFAILTSNTNNVTVGKITLLK